MNVDAPVAERAGAPAPAPMGPVKEDRQRSWWGRHGRRTTVWSLRVALLLAFLGLWQLAHGFVSNPMFISNPIAIGDQLGVWLGDGTLVFHTWITVQEVAAGYTIGVVTGALLGFALASVHLIYDVFEPFMMALGSAARTGDT
ncbi:hypothetical protein [Agrococcus sp. ARC_14]|uniref:ABC transporter permease n=1 Tax=Agrococcus sp. ARC_14 TaxID=2919927 RepID=UPI001F058951|nr:hypothetical protein [Agrococcus sp. ARC_14]MCH1881324.1 hypothetical protein [Agrococcus sp. ARC_14]